MKAGPSLLRSASYGAVMFASSALNNVWVTYYLAVLAGHSSTDRDARSVLAPSWFFIGQTIFMIWNAVNDPLFGWLSDISAFRQGRRTTAIRLGGYAWCAAFLFTWFPVEFMFEYVDLLGRIVGMRAEQVDWMISLLPGAHFVLCLVLYDGSLTLVEVNHGALLAEMASSPAARAEANMWAAVAAALGSATSYPAHLAWNAGERRGWNGTRDLGPFRRFALGLALACACVFSAASYGLRLAGAERASMSKRSGKSGEHGDGDEGSGEEGEGDLNLEGVVEEGTSRRRAGGAINTGAQVNALGTDGPLLPTQQGTGTATGLSFWAFAAGLARQPNFLLFSAFAAVQAFDCSLGKTMFTPIMDTLVRSSSVGVGGLGDARTVALCLSFLAPHLLTVCLTPMLRTQGVYGAVWLVLGLRLMAVVGGSVRGAWSGGKESAWGGWSLPLLLLLTSRVTSECVCRLLYPLVLTDVIDEDVALHSGRMEPLGDKGEGEGAIGDGLSPATAASLPPTTPRRMGMGASVAGASAFASKLAASAAPMLGYWLMGTGLGEGMGGGGDTMQGRHGSKTTGPSPSLWPLTVAVPLAVVALQFVLWRSYGLHGQYLKTVKDTSKKAEEGGRGGDRDSSV